MGLIKIMNDPLQYLLDEDLIHIFYWPYKGPDEGRMYNGWIIFPSGQKPDEFTSNVDDQTITVQGELYILSEWFYQKYGVFCKDEATCHDAVVRYREYYKEIVPGIDKALARVWGGIA